MIDAYSRLAPGYQFLVCLGTLTFSFSKITGISGEINTTTLNEGGVNDRPITLYAPKQSSDRLIFEHGLGIINPINQHFETAKLGYYFQMPGMILTFSEGHVHRVYAYSGAKPVKWSLSELNALDSSILIDTVEILHDGIFEIPYLG